MQEISRWMGMLAVKTYIERTGIFDDCATNPYFKVALGQMLWENMGSRMIAQQKQTALN